MYSFIQTTECSKNILIYWYESGLTSNRKWSMLNTFFYLLQNFIFNNQMIYLTDNARNKMG